MNNTTVEQPLQQITSVLKKILCSFVGYYDGALNCFETSSNGELTLKQVSEHNIDKKFLILIVARNFYSEQARNYPVENKKELKKLLNLEFSSSSALSKTFFHSWPDCKKTSDKVNTQSAVNIWQFNNCVPTAYLTLPESLLFSRLVEANQVLDIGSSGASYVARIEQLIHSLNKTAVVNTTQRFAMSIGISESFPAQVINNKNFPCMLALGFKKLPLSIFASFIKRPEITDRFELIKNITLPALTILSLYLASTSGYLIYKKHTLHQQLSVQHEEVSEALAQQVVFDNKSMQYEALQKFITAQKNSTPFWLIMAELFPTAEFTNIRINRNRFVLRGRANKATDVLERLTNYKQVSDAKFDFPVSNNRGKEVFVISFELTQMSNPQNEELISSEEADD